MNTEIELKFLVLESSEAKQTAEKITELLTAKKFSFVSQQKQLNNSYFDTPDLALRRQDKGLRIRTSIDNLDNKHLEQTIKTAGTAVGGLHQRPEYNVDITNNFPELALFPQAIWPKNQNLNELQAQLVSLFTTNFQRLIWLITIENNGHEATVIELVFDQGVIKANGNEVPICEIELELVTGNIDDLLTLAKVLCFGLLLRPGIKTKAARGYALSSAKDRQSTTKNIDNFDLLGLALIPLDKPKSLNHVFTHGVEFGLTQLQTLVDAYTQNPAFSILNKITEMLALLRQGFWLFEQSLDKSMGKLRNELSFFIKKFHWVEDACHLQELTTKTGNYRTKLHYSDALIRQMKSERSNFPDAEQNILLFHSARFNRLQLSLLTVLLAKKPHFNVDSTQVSIFAESALELNRKNLIEVMPKNGRIESQEYLAHHKLLIRSLLTGSWFGALYDKNERLAFRNPWLDIKQGISELQTLLLLQQQLLKLTTPESKLTKWLESKIEHLLHTLEHSREQAVSAQPYWRI
ncbi:MAG: CYTH domain-containing protein [Colwellia sp.]|nr:CYTH domain-containing protein [Colwellia sp.]